MELISTKQIALEKLQQEQNPSFVFADLDGTLFSPNIDIIKAPFYNQRTQSFLKAHNIPLAIVTGRSDWTDIDKRQLLLLGFSQPDIIITAAGTIIYTLMKNNTYQRDLDWESFMQYSKVSWTNDNMETWNKQDITNVIQDYFVEHSISYTLSRGNTFLIRFKVNSLPVERLIGIQKDILMLFPIGIRCLISEKLLWKNTTDIFSGDILIVPKSAGKDNAIKYILQSYSKKLGKTIHADIFGDASIDVGMLSMKANARYYTLSQYLVHPTPLAKLTIQKAQKINDTICILPNDGPKEILQIVTKNYSPETTKSFYGESSVETKPSPQTKLSPAQNNPVRKVVKTLEPLLNTLVDKKLSPNEVSFLGLKKLANGLNKLYQPKSTIVEKVLGIYDYGFGNLTDVLDGIRARHSDKKEENGQLVDGFSDRAKEFMQLFLRGKKRMKTDNIQGLQTFLTALSCALPSIARAQAEIAGKAVPEKDEKGGSMIDRTKRLFKSIGYDALSLSDKSFAIDEEIYITNIATFKNRLAYSKNLDINKVKKDSLSTFQKEALERFLLYVDVLQQEDKIIGKYLAKNKDLLQEYNTQSKKITNQYLEVSVTKLRGKFGIKDYKLLISHYL